MATSYNTIYDMALSKMREYSFLDMEDNEIYEALSPFLKSAEADFARICLEPLNDVYFEKIKVSKDPEASEEPDVSEDANEPENLNMVVEELGESEEPETPNEPNEPDEFEEVAKGYNADLSSESIEILALGVVCHWSTAYVADADKLRNALGTKDYSVFSPANLLNSVRALRDNFLLEYHDKINRYSFLYGDLIRKEAWRNLPRQAGPKHTHDGHHRPKCKQD